METVRVAISGRTEIEMRTLDLMDNSMPYSSRLLMRTPDLSNRAAPGFGIAGLRRPVSLLRDLLSAETGRGTPETGRAVW